MYGNVWLAIHIIKPKFSQGLANPFQQVLNEISNAKLRIESGSNSLVEPSKNKEGVDVEELDLSHVAFRHREKLEKKASITRVAAYQQRQHRSNTAAAAQQHEQSFKSRRTTCCASFEYIGLERTHQLIIAQLQLQYTTFHSTAVSARCTCVHRAC